MDLARRFGLLPVGRKRICFSQDGSGRSESGRTLSRHPCCPPFDGTRQTRVAAHPGQGRPPFLCANALGLYPETAAGGCPLPERAKRSGHFVDEGETADSRLAGLPLLRHVRRADLSYRSWDHSRPRLALAVQGCLQRTNLPEDRRYVVVQRPGYRDFELQVPQTPGLGVQLDADKLAFYRRDRVSQSVAVTA